MTLDLTPCLPNRVLHSILGQWEAHLQAPLWLLFSTAYVLRQHFLAFRVLSFPDGCNQLGSRSLFFMRSQLSLPEFLSLLVSMPACTLPMGSFNRDANQTLSRLSKILISILIQSEKFLSHSNICKSYVLNESSAVDFCTSQRKFPFSLFDIYSPTSKNHSRLLCTFLSVSTWMQNLIWDKAEPNKIL